MFKRSGSLLLSIFMSAMVVASSSAADKSVATSPKQKTIVVLRSLQAKLKVGVKNARLTALTGGIGVGVFALYCRVINPLIAAVKRHELAPEKATFAALPLYAQICCCTGAAIAFTPWAAAFTYHALDTIINYLESDVATA